MIMRGGRLAALRRPARASGLEPVWDYTEAEEPYSAPRTMEVVNRGGRRRLPVVVANGRHPRSPTVRRHAHGIAGFTQVGPRAEIRQLAARSTRRRADRRWRRRDRRRPDHVGMASSVLVRASATPRNLKRGSTRCPARTAVLSHGLRREPVRRKISDSGSTPTGEEDRDLENAIRTARALGVRRPRVALAAGMEDKGQDYPAIADAREIVRRHRAGEWPEAVIDGPFGVDVAIYSEATALKGISTPVSGVADVIITPNLESCNIGVKLMVAASGRPSAGVVVGGGVPMVLGSRPTTPRRGCAASRWRSWWPPASPRRAGAPPPAMTEPLPLALLKASPLWDGLNGGTLVVACSGGRDSVALARAAHALLNDPDFRARFATAPELFLWHMDHGLRPASGADAEFVRRLALALDVECEVYHAELGEELTRNGGNAEELARAERYRVLLERLDNPYYLLPLRLPGVAATAHHLGDQAETSLFNLVRGTHLKALRDRGGARRRHHRGWDAAR
jgi:hypothetical protein